MFDAKTLATLTRLTQDVESPHERARIFLEVLLDASRALTQQDDSDAGSYRREAAMADAENAAEAYSNAIWSAERSALSGATWLAVKAAKDAAHAAWCKAG